MKRSIWATGLALAAILSAPHGSPPRAEEVIHHGITVESEGSVFECLSCHDGLVGKQILLSTMIGKYFCNHPVNRDYPPVGKSDDYAPVEQVISAGIKLINGQISCISCHNLQKQEKFHLSVPMDNSNLCFTCHKV